MITNIFKRNVQQDLCEENVQTVAKEFKVYLRLRFISKVSVMGATRFFIHVSKLKKAREKMTRVRDGLNTG